MGEVMNAILFIINETLPKVCTYDNANTKRNNMFINSDTKVSYPFRKPSFLSGVLN